MKEILEKKIKQIFDIIDKIESKETARDVTSAHQIIAKHQDSIHHSYTFGPHFVLFYRTMLLLFHACLKLVDSDDGRIGLLKSLNEILFNSQLFDQKIKSWESLSQMKSKILDFQLEIKNSLAKMIP